MDPITHTLTGAALAQAGLKRSTALAWPALLIGANLPDVDIFAYLHGDVEALAFRRGITHGLLAVVVLPLLLTGVLIGWDRLVREPRARRHPPPGSKGKPKPRARVKPASLLLVSTAGVWSHPILDWLNIYGIRLLSPFSEKWFYGDALFIVDPWVWLALALGVWLSRARGPLPARLALGAFAAYGAAMWTGSAVARAEVKARFGEEASPARVGMEGARPEIRDVLAAPVPLDPRVRELLVDIGPRYLRGRIDATGTLRLDPPDGGLPKGMELGRRAGAHPHGRAFLFWARHPYFESVPGGVRIGDARYPGEWATVTVPEQDTP